jgi:hypothetical protein
METNPEFNHYMDRHFDFSGQWESPSKCGLRVIKRKDGTTLAIVTEIYRQNPGTPVTEWVAPLATQILKELDVKPETFLLIEHTPDLRSKRAFYEETFDQVNFDWDGEKFFNPQWTRLTRDQVDRMMEA